ncbi:hypothetical protein JOF55_003207 [Haloactinomyces albus]|uniref:Uncharacterized protein n=1 Tax=Haloactinomyces albus TaxID=1352928 RepID=A0AAE4CN33_9ACTN|nr:hypothetical protein [Haloactinomyces albus]
MSTTGAISVAFTVEERDSNLEDVHRERTHQ